MPRTCSLRPKSLPTSLLHSPFLALRRCVSPPAGCGESLRATRSAGSCRDAWHANMPTRSTRPPAPTSLPFRHALALMLCLACCVLPSILMPMPRSSHWMAAVLTTPSLAPHSCASCARSPQRSCRSSACGTARSPRTTGGTLLAPDGASVKAKAAGRATAWAPALYALGQHDALVAADERLQPGECLAAFLDDVYVVTTPARAREALDVVTTSIQDRAGVAANLGKTRVYNRAGGPAPAGIAELGEAVWTGNAPEAERGFLALGTPIGHPAYVASHTDARLREEARLLQELPLLPDLQCAWLILAMCAAPRADHLLRTLPPDLSASYARGMRPRRRSLAVSARASWRAGRPRSRSRCRTTPGALAGAPRRTRTPMCGARRSCRILGCVGRRFARSAAASPRGCCALSGRTRSRLSILCPLLARCRCSWRPLHPRRMGGWSAIHDGLRPAQCDLPEPGERCQGWQHHGSRACSSLPHQADVGPMDPAAAPRSMFTVITMLPAPAPAFSPGEPSHSSARGYGSCAKQSGQRARSFRNSGSFGRLPQVSIRTIAGVSTSSHMVPRSSAKHCAAT